jgi:hypothetical protein
MLVVVFLNEILSEFGSYTCTIYVDSVKLTNSAAGAGGGGKYSITVWVDSAASLFTASVN